MEEPHVVDYFIALCYYYLAFITLLCHVHVHCAITCVIMLRHLQVIEETLSPTWNQMLIIDDITLPFPADWMKANPPVITIELYDHDKIVRNNYIFYKYMTASIALAVAAFLSPIFTSITPTLSLSLCSA